MAETHEHRTRTAQALALGTLFGVLAGLAPARERHVQEIESDPSRRHDAGWDALTLPEATTASAVTALRRAAETRTLRERRRTSRRRWAARTLRLSVVSGLSAFGFLATSGLAGGPAPRIDPTVTDPVVLAARARAIAVADYRLQLRDARTRQLAARRHELLVLARERRRILELRRLELAGIAGRAVGLSPRQEIAARRELALSLLPRPTPSDRAVALDRFVTAVGPDALIDGLDGIGDSLGARILADPRITVYPAGRPDIANGRVDVRVLALIAYLAEAHGQVTVSALITGHRYYARPGVVSAHVSGHAVDIAALGGVSIVGHQQPGGVTEQALREILALPKVMYPKQLISLFDLGGPTFALENHADHIHIGY